MRTAQENDTTDRSLILHLALKLSMPHIPIHWRMALLCNLIFSKYHRIYHWCRLGLNFLMIKTMWASLHSRTERASMTIHCYMPDDKQLTLTRDQSFYEMPPEQTMPPTKMAIILTVKVLKNFDETLRYMAFIDIPLPWNVISSISPHRWQRPHLFYQLSWYHDSWWQGVWTSAAMVLT